jgi:hypothetical protein
MKKESIKRAKCLITTRNMIMVKSVGGGAADARLLGGVVADWVYFFYWDC